MVERVLRRLRRYVPNLDSLIRRRRREDVSKLAVPGQPHDGVFV